MHFPIIQKNTSQMAGIRAELRWLKKILFRMDLSGLAIGLQAAGTHMFPNFSPTFIKSGPLNVRPELTFCMLHREANVVSKLWSLATNFAFSHNQTSSRQTKSDRIWGRSISKRTS
jgi:hypothetical protein